MGTMTKKELARSVAEAAGCRKNLAAEMTDSLFAMMRDMLIEGDRIEIRGFGVLETRNTRSKPAARNPRTGETISVPARRKTHFRPGKLLKEGLYKDHREN